MQAIADKAGAKHQDRAVGLSLLSGEGPQGPVQPLAGRDQALLRARQHDRGASFWTAGRALRSRLHGDHRHGAGLAPGHPHLAASPTAATAARSASSTATISRAPASARAPGRPAIAAARACSATRSCSARTTTISPSRRPGEPVLISLDDAETLFHEFGHAIHYFLTDVNYPSFGGTPRDFVEYPSQVHENWVLTPEVLSQLRQALPDRRSRCRRRWSTRSRRRRTFNQGFATVEYLSSALVDMELHMDPNGVVDPDAFERETLARLGMPSEMVMRHRLPQFNHLFSSDAYSAGYYSYLWSETMDADTWAAFEEAGNVWDKATARPLPRDLAVDRQRDRPRRGLSRLPRPRSGRQRPAQEARLPDQIGRGQRPREKAASRSGRRLFRVDRLRRSSARRALRPRAA